MLCRLLYVSRITDAAASDLPGAMEDILVVSAELNRRDAITGFLLADGVSFVQVLEGPDVAVTACYERILKDGRHTDVRLRFLAGIDRRRFPRWSMCGLCLADLDDTLLSPPDIGFELIEADAGSLIQHLEGIAFRHGSDLDAAHAGLLRAAAAMRAREAGGPPGSK